MVDPSSDRPVEEQPADAAPDDNGPAGLSEGGGMLVPSAEGARLVAEPADGAWGSIATMGLFGPPSEPLGGDIPPGTLSALRYRPQRAMSIILEALVRESANVHPDVQSMDVGTVRQVGDGVASVWGLPDARLDDLLLFPSGVLGLIMNLEAEWIDCILLGPDTGIQGGDMVWPTGRRLLVPTGDRLLGRVIDPLGGPLDGKGRLVVDERRPFERVAPGVVERQAVDEPLHTGIKAVDAIVPIGRGQRELIVGDRQTGKTALALDAIISQKDTDVLSVYVSVGQRKSSVLQVVDTLDRAGALDSTVVVMASPDDPPALVYLAPYVGITVAEYYADRGDDVLIVYDDLTRHADAYRELSLLLRRPPGREAYPGDIFYLHSRLLERSARLGEAHGGGSITALPIIETRRGNISAYVPTNLISITDGQIYLSPELFSQGVRPAIDVGLSVSRVGGAAQKQIMREVSGQLKLALAQYEEVAHFSRFGTEVDRATQQQIARGVLLREVLKQGVLEPLSLWQEVVIIFAATRGYMDAIEPADVRAYERSLWGYARREHRSVIRRIEQSSDLDRDLVADLHALIAGHNEAYPRTAT